MIYAILITQKILTKTTKFILSPNFSPLITPSHYHTALKQIPNTNTINHALQACTDLKTLIQLHTQIVISGLQQNPFLGNKLVSMYAKYGSPGDAQLVFDKIHEKNIYLWNTIIKGFSTNGLSRQTLTVYYKMQDEGVYPNDFTFPLVLKACTDLSALQEGKDIHYHIVRNGFSSNVFVGTALIHMYAKFGCVEDARQVFDKMSEPDVVSWTAMILGYAQGDQANEALVLFHQLQLVGVVPDSVTVVGVLQACARLGTLEEGKLVHGYVIRSGFQSDAFVGTSLVDMYAKCGIVDVARRVFDKMSKRNVVSWNAMISGYAQNGFADEALGLFRQMELEGVKPNSSTMVSLLLACAHLGALQQGKWFMIT
jgi:pentatricopeptide repeat protein